MGVWVYDVKFDWLQYTHRLLRLARAKDFLYLPNFKEKDYTELLTKALRRFPMQQPWLAKHPDLTLADEFKQRHPGTALLPPLSGIYQIRIREAAVADDIKARELRRFMEVKDQEDRAALLAIARELAHMEEAIQRQKLAAIKVERDARQARVDEIERRQDADIIQLKESDARTYAAKQKKTEAKLAAEEWRQMNLDLRKETLLREAFNFAVRRDQGIERQQDLLAILAKNMAHYLQKIAKESGPPGTEDGVKDAFRVGSGAVRINPSASPGIVKGEEVLVNNSLFHINSHLDYNEMAKGPKRRMAFVTQTMDQEVFGGADTRTATLLNEVGRDPEIAELGRTASYTGNTEAAGRQAYAKQARRMRRP